LRPVLVEVSQLVSELFSLSGIEISERMERFRQAAPRSEVIAEPMACV